MSFLKKNNRPLLFIISFLFFLGATENCPAQDFKFLLIANKLATTSQKITYNVGKSLSDASVDFEILDSQEFPAVNLEKMKNYQALVFLGEKAADFAFNDDILQYIETGGNVCIGIHSWNNDWLQTLGISLVIPEEVEYLDCAGLKSQQPMFKKIEIDVEPEMLVTTAMNLTFSPEWEVLLGYKSPELPMLLQRTYGKGNVIFWNSSALSEKTFRGLFLFSIFRKLPVAAFSVMNAFLMNLDDSPPPAYGIKEGPVFRDLQMTDRQFYERIWLKSVFTLLEEFKIPVTHFACLNYDDTIIPPFTAKVDREPFFSEYLALAKSRGHELSFHGFNHQSLTMGESPSKPWGSQADMKASCEAGFKVWQKYQLPPTLIYAAPNNVIDKAGKLALIEGFPTIRVICRIYQDSWEYKSTQRNGYLIGPQDTNFNPEMMSKIFSMYASRKAKARSSASDFFAGDEFGTDPEVPELLDLPRISSGHTSVGFGRLAILNGIMAHGIVSHYFHPDDMYDPSRREDTWEKTFLSMRRLFVFLESASSHFRKLKTGIYIQEFKEYIYSKTKITSDNSRQIKINPGQRPFYYLFVDDKAGVPVLKNADIISEIEPGRLFLIKARKDAEINLQ